MNNSYCIYIITPYGYAHSDTFVEVAQALQEGLAELGYVAPIVRRAIDVVGRAIVLGANVDQRVPPDSIIFNLEQTGTAWITDSYLALMKGHETWHYRKEDLPRLKHWGVQAKWCGVGYAPCLTRIPHAEEDVDVLFYGSIFGRREPILKAIAETGVNLKTLFGVYGEERDRWIARSKIVLNLHAYEESPFEIVRVSYLLANNKFVLSEPGVPEELRLGVASADAEVLPKLCQFYAHTPDARHGIAQAGFRFMSSRRQVDYLRALLPPFQH